MQLRMPLLASIANESASRMETFSSQGVANLCWALAKVKHDTPKDILRVFEQHALTNFPDYSSQGTSLLLWGLAQQGYRPKGLLELMGRELQNYCGQFSPDSLAAVLGAFATMEHRDVETITAIMRQIQDNLEQFDSKPHLLCSIMWAVCMLNMPRAKCACRPPRSSADHAQQVLSMHAEHAQQALSMHGLRARGAYPALLAMRLPLLQHASTLLPVGRSPR
jgi:hypothetical protein